MIAISEFENVFNDEGNNIYNLYLQPMWLLNE